jgi:hypothetical protein
MQTFQPDKERLWRRLYARVLIGNSKNLVLHGETWAGIRALVSAIRTSPADSFSYAASKSICRVRELSKH